jgi:hypothetical protein
MTIQFLACVGRLHPLFFSSSTFYGNAVMIFTEPRADERTGEAVIN